MKKLLLPLMLAATLVQPTWADAVPGDKTIFVGMDLTPAQQQQMYQELGKTDQDRVIYVYHKDELNALQGKVPDAVIGTKAISSGSLTIAAPGTGLNVHVHNITWVSDDMYKNALVTAGVKDANIEVTAPFPVSGTAALTGLTEAFQVSTGTTLDSNRVNAANQEVVTTSQLGQDIGNQQKAAAFVGALKDKMQQEKPVTDADYQRIIHEVSQQMGISLTQDEINKLMALLKQLNSLHVNWSQLDSQVVGLKDKINQFMNNHQQQTNAFRSFFEQVLNAIQNLFHSLFG